MGVILRQQHSIAKTVSVAGFGYWSGEDVRIEFRPAEPDTGIVFVRGDLTPPVRIEATVERRIEMSRRTTLAKAGIAVEMVEHILAALAGLQVDNCEIWTDRPEMPGCDGSSLPFVEALLKAGIVSQQARRQVRRIGHTVRVGDGQSWVEARPTVLPHPLLRYQLDYGTNSAIGRQELDVALTPETFASHLAGARTFLLQAEAEWMRSRGLGRRVSYQDVLVFNCQGPLHNRLRFADECVRHKALDLVGDLALAGCDLLGEFVAYRSGHRLNAELVRTLLAGDATCQPWRPSA